MGKRAVGSKIPRPRQLRIIASLNSMYIYKGVMYTFVFVWSLIGFAGGIKYHAWDREHLGKALYFLLYASLIGSPVLTLIASRVKQQIVSLYFSFAADSSIAFGIFAYSMIIFSEFGFVIGCPLLWGLSFGLMIYCISDVMLIRLINSQPDLANEELLETVRNEISRARLKEFVGIRKWQGLIEAAGGAQILEEIMAKHNSK